MQDWRVSCDNALGDDLILSAASPLAAAKDFTSLKHDHGQDCVILVSRYVDPNEKYKFRRASAVWLDETADSERTSNAKSMLHKSGKENDMHITTRFRIAGWFSIANAVLVLPVVVASVLAGVAEASGAISDLSSRIIAAVMSVIGYAVGIVVLITLRELFEQRYEYRGVSKILTTFITLSAVGILASALAVISSTMESVVAMLSVIIAFVMGIISIVYGIKLLSFHQDLYGLRKPYAWTSIAGGVCFATVILMPIGLLLAMASSVFLAIIFFREAEGLHRPHPDLSSKHQSNPSSSHAQRVCSDDQADSASCDASTRANSQVVTLKYSVTSEDFLNYNLWFFKHSDLVRNQKSKALQWTLVVGALVVAVAAFSSGWATALLCLAIYAVLSMFFSIHYDEVLRKNTEQLINSSSYDGVFGTHHLTLFDKGLQEVGPEITSDIKWEAVRQVCKEGDLVFVVLSHGVAIIINRNSYEGTIAFDELPASLEKRWRSATALNHS